MRTSGKGSDRLVGELDLSTRAKRRMAVSRIVGTLSRIRDEEEAYAGRIPDNLQGGDASAAAEDSIDLLTDAIDALADAY